MALSSVLLIIVPEGNVQNRVLFESDGQTELIEAANFINQNYAGHAIDDSITARTTEQLRRCPHCGGNHRAVMNYPRT
jgi:heat-inducible transcriptional repressor